MGRRVAKKVNGVVVEKYLWHGLTQLLAVYDGSDNLIMRFQYADDRMPVAMTGGGTTYYLTYDQVGSLRIVTDASGNVIKRIDYDSFGNVINDTNLGFVIPFGFAGGLYDRDTGLVKFGFRDYDPNVGRWIAKDPIGFAGSDINLYGYISEDPILKPWNPNVPFLLPHLLRIPSLLNAYIYTCNNPINWVDPYGLKWVKTGPNWYDWGWQPDYPGQVETIGKELEKSGLDQIPHLDPIEWPFEYYYHKKVKDKEKPNCK